MAHILYHFRYKARYWSKIAAVSYYPAFDDPVRGFPFECCRKDRCGKTRMVWLSDGEKVWGWLLVSFWQNKRTWQTDGQTDTAWAALVHSIARQHRDCRPTSRFISEMIQDRHRYNEILIGSYTRLTQRRNSNDLERPWVTARSSTTRSDARPLCNSSASSCSFCQYRCEHCTCHNDITITNTHMTMNSRAMFTNWVVCWLE